MKVVRYIDKKELEELIKTNKVLPKHKLFIEKKNNPIKLTLNIMRSKLDTDDLEYFYIPNGYSMQNVMFCEYKNEKGTPWDIMKKL